MDTILYLCLIPFALLLDKVLGELPTRYHPVAIMGIWAAKVEKLARCLLSYIDKRGADKRNTDRINIAKISLDKIRSGKIKAGKIRTRTEYSENKWVLRLFGLLSALFTVSPFILIPILSVALVNTSIFLTTEIREFLSFTVTLFCLYLCIAPHSLAKHAFDVANPLEKDDIIEARKAVSAIVGRSTKNMDSFGVARACVESVGENVTDSTLSSIFWASVGLILYGYTGAIFFVLLHRCFNTLDAMWGKRSEKYQYFGTFAARVDDVLNFFPARLSLFAIVIASYFTKETTYKEAFRVAYAYRYAHHSPNSAWSEAAFAGALGLKLGGPVTYENLPRESLPHANSPHANSPHKSLPRGSFSDKNLPYEDLTIANLSGESLAHKTLSNSNLSNASLLVDYPYFGDGTLHANAAHIHLAIKLMWNCVWVFSFLSCVFIYILTH